MIEKQLVKQLHVYEFKVNVITINGETERVIVESWLKRTIEINKRQIELFPE